MCLIQLYVAFVIRPEQGSNLYINALEEHCLLHLATETKYYGGEREIRTLVTPFEANFISSEAT